MTDIRQTVPQQEPLFSMPFIQERLRVIESELQPEALSYATPWGGEGLIFAHSVRNVFDTLKGTRIIGERSPSRWVLEHRQPIFLTHPHYDPRVDPSIEQVVGFSSRAIAALPLVPKGKHLGALELFNPLDEPTCTEKQRSALVAAMGRFHNADDVPSALADFLDEVKTQVPCQGLLLIGASPGLASLTIIHSHFRELDKLQGMKIAPGQGFLGWVAEHMKPLLIADAARDLRFFSVMDRISGFQTRSVLTYPLIENGTLSGVFQALNPLHRPCFTHEDVAFVAEILAEVGAEIMTAEVAPDDGPCGSADQRQESETPLTQ